MVTIYINYLDRSLNMNLNTLLSGNSPRSNTGGNRSTGAGVIDASRKWRHPLKVTQGQVEFALRTGPAVLRSDLLAQPGQTIALVWSGKSSIINLFRFMTLKKARFSLMDKPIMTIPVRVFVRKWGLCFKTLIFHWNLLLQCIMGNV